MLKFSPRSISFQMNTISEHPMIGRKACGGFALFVLILSAARRCRGEAGQPFTDHMVLQRDKKVPSGAGRPRRSVTVEFRPEEIGQGPRGKWRVNLDSLRASDEGRR